MAKADKQRCPLLPLVVHHIPIGARFGHIIDAGQMFVVPLHETSHLHEAAQLTGPHAGSTPVQMAEHSPVPQESVPHAALPPEQFVRHRPVVHVMLPQALLPAQVASQSPAPHVIVPHAALPLPPEQSALQSPVVQLMLPHAALPVHVASQLPVVHCTLPQACCPVHATVQFFVLHVMPRQALSALHVMSHDAELPQLIVPQAPPMAHVMSQFHPVGQVMLPLPVPVIVHVVVWTSQLSQADGHSKASSGRASAGREPITQ